MMKNIFFILLLVISCSEKQEVNFLSIKLEEAFNNAKHGNKLVLVDFYSKSCFPCKVLVNTVFKDNKISKYINQHFISVKITQDHHSNYWELRKKYNVIGLPTVVFFNSKGEEIDRNCGFDGDKTAYFQSIQDYVSDKNTLHKLLSNYKRDSLSVDNNFLLAMKFVNRNELEKSDKYFKNVLNIDKENKYSYHERSQLYLALYKISYNDKPSSLLKFIKDSNNSKYVKLGYDYLFNFYEKHKDTTNYIATCNEAISRLPAIDLAYWRLINFYKNKKDTSMLLSTCKTAVSNMPNNSGYFHRYAIMVYDYKLRYKYDEAISMAKTATEISPDSDNIWYTLSLLYNEMGDTKNALLAIKRAIKINPKKDKYKSTLNNFESL